MSKYVDWFTEAVSPKPQTEDYILPRMAMTIVQPDHPAALKNSCHALAAREIARLKSSGELTPDHRIAMVGLSTTVYHTVLTDGEKVVFDSLDRDFSKNKYDPDGNTYFSKEHSTHLRVMKDISVQDFLKDYVAKVIVSKPSDYAPSEA